MLTLHAVTKEDGDLLRSYYAHCDFSLCEYAAGTKIMWREELHSHWGEAAGCLIAANEIRGRLMFDYPVAGPEGDEEAALLAIETYCVERGLPLIFGMIPEEKSTVILERYPYIQVGNLRHWRDYLYHREDLQNFAGRRYSGQRNHIKKFYAQYPQAQFRQLHAADKEVIDRFWDDYEKEFAKADNQKAINELRWSKEMMELLDKPWFVAGGMFVEDKLVSLALAERCGQTLVTHLEKAIYSYQGVYPATVQAFAQTFGGDCTWINREDDAADKGLRTSKLQYGPAKLTVKYRFEMQNELQHHICQIPALTTERLTLTPLEEEDIPAYNALVLDQDRNRWWGYDDVGGLNSPVTERSFFDVARRDWEHRLAVNFAVRLDGKLIGEAVLYRFDFRGGAELGCRIDKAYAGHGYGTEAFAAVAEWGLYKAYLSRVVAKCYKENEASRKMLASCMRPKGEDETFYYFEKTV